MRTQHTVRTRTYSDSLEDDLLELVCDLLYAEVRLGIPPRVVTEFFSLRGIIP